MLNPLVRRLKLGVELGADDIKRLERMSADPRRFAAREDLIRMNESPNCVRLVLSGTVCRYKIMPDGQRAIIAYLLPGDLCHFHVAMLDHIDHSIGTLSPCLVVDISDEAISDLEKHHPRIVRALWWSTLVNQSISQEWLASMGRRHADRRLAHLFCEIYTRLESIGLTEGTAFKFPVTQENLADTLGLSTVHVNRIVQQLRDEGLLDLRRGNVRILDLPRLQNFAGFDDTYLFLKSASGLSQVGVDEETF